MRLHPVFVILLATAGCSLVPCEQYFPNDVRCVGYMDMQMAQGAPEMPAPVDMLVPDMRPPPCPASKEVMPGLTETIALRWSKTHMAPLHSQGMKIFQGTNELYLGTQKVQNFSLEQVGTRLFIGDSNGIILKQGDNQNRLAGYSTAPVDLLYHKVAATTFLYIADPARTDFPVGVGRLTVPAEIKDNVGIQPISLTKDADKLKGHAPFALALTASRDALYASYPTKGWIVKFPINTTNGDLQPGAVIRDKEDQPEGLATDTEGNLYIATKDGLIARHPKDQECFLPLTPRPRRLAFDNKNTLYYTTDTEIRSVTLGPDIVGVP